MWTLVLRAELSFGEGNIIRQIVATDEFPN